MADKKPMIKGPDIYIGGKAKAKKPSWEAKELDDINRYWRRPWLGKEGKRQANVRITSTKSATKRRSNKS